MAEWLYEEGIGENRAVLVEAGDIVEAVIELPSDLAAGAVVEGRLAAVLPARRAAKVMLPSGEEVLIEPVPPVISEGQLIRIEITRETLPEANRVKLPKGRVTTLSPRPGPTLIDRIRGLAAPVAVLAPHGPDRLEEAGWSELLEQAALGDIAFAGGALRMSLTPAMTLFDVDGDLAPADLAIAGAAAAGRAIRRFGIGGSIGIDLPTVPGRGERQAAAAALDAVLPQPFERTSVNGFGFLQLVRRRERASLPEIVQADPVGAAARSLLRRAARSSGTGPCTISAAPAVVVRIERNPLWVEELRRRRGTSVALRPDSSLAISAGHVQNAFA